MQSINDIKHGFYINLQERSDRKLHLEAQLALMGLANNGIERFNAIKLANGAIGCSMSHLKCLELAKERSWDHVLILEDDIKFLNPALFKVQCSAFLRNKADKWDVVLFAGNNMPPYTPIDATCIKVQQCQTATGYLVQKHYYDTLIHNFRTGLQELIKQPLKHVQFALDRYWFKLQRRDKWFLIMPLTVVQRGDYSNIEKRQVDYGKAMTDLNKTALLQKNSGMQFLT